MTVDKTTTSHARHLLAELIEHREKLMGNLLHPRAAGNLEEKAYDQVIERLGAVQGCIAATRELLRGEDGGEINYNHLHRASGHVISGTSDPITVGDIRDAIAALPDETEVTWGTCSHGEPLNFYRFNSRGDDLLGIELN